MMAQDGDSLLERLKHDKMTKIHTHDDPLRPYFVPRTLLEEQSEFIASRTHDWRTITTKENNTDAWKTFIQWLVERQLPVSTFPKKGNRTPDLEPIVKCYILGEQWGMKAFQDEVMLFLLEAAEMHRMKSSWQLKNATLVAFSKGAQDSKLRTFFVEEALAEHYTTGQIFGMEMDPGDVAKFEGLGFFPLYHQKWDGGEGQYPGTSRFDGEACRGRYFWKKYMVGPPEKYEAARYQQFREDDGDE